MAETFSIRYILRNIKPPFQGDEMELDPSNIMKFYFIESIENMFITGLMEFEDKGGSIEKLSITGEEILSVNIEQNIEDRDDANNSIQSSKTFEFEIHKTVLKNSPGIRRNLYQFHLIENGASEFFKKTYSKSYSQKRTSEIIEDICRFQLQLTSENYEIEQTGNNIDYIIPYWKPSVTIKDLIKISQRQNTPKEGGFLFYSTSGDLDDTEPSKKFKSFYSLITSDVDTSIQKRYYLKKFDINAQSINVIKDFRNPIVNNRMLLNNGIAGKKYYNMNLISDRIITEIEKSYSEYIQNTSLLGTKSFLPSDIDDTDSEIESFGHIDTELVKAYQDHRFRMNLENFNKREGLLEGSMDRFAGKKIYIEEMSDDSGTPYNEQNTGEWIIKSLTWYFGVNSFEQKAIFLKDAYAETDIEGLINL